MMTVVLLVVNWVGPIDGNGFKYFTLDTIIISSPSSFTNYSPPTNTATISANPLSLPPLAAFIRMEFHLRAI